MTSWLALGAIAGGAAAASVAATGLVTRYLRQQAILDHPNERSSHVVPTPRGGGWGILVVTMPGWALVGVNPWVLVGMAVLAGVSWLDDRRGLPPWPRLVAQVVAVLAGLAALGDAPVFGPVFGPGSGEALPWWLDRGLAGLGWLWFLNLFNFMDGIDGLAGTEAVSVSGGLVLVTALTTPALVPPELVGAGAVLAGAALGFLVWNWQPARVFMGDVGSVPVGFALGWLLVSAAAAGLWPAVLLLPLYFVADASMTLLRRAAAGKPLLEAHREHFYQRAVQGGVSHARVVRTVLAANAVLTVLALAAVRVGWPVVPAGALVVLVLLWTLHAAARKIRA